MNCSIEVNAHLCTSFSFRSKINKTAFLSVRCSAKLTRESLRKGDSPQPAERLDYVVSFTIKHSFHLQRKEPNFVGQRRFGAGILGCSSATC